MKKKKWLSAATWRDGGEGDDGGGDGRTTHKTDYTNCTSNKKSFIFLPPKK